MYVMLLYPVHPTSLGSAFVDSGQQRCPTSMYDLHDSMVQRVVTLKSECESFAGDVIILPSLTECGRL